MPRSHKRQGPPVCTHEEPKQLCEFMSILQNVSSTAESSNAFDFSQLRGLGKFLECCTQEQCPHFRRAFINHLWHDLCQSSARVLQLLQTHNISTGSFQQYPQALGVGVERLLSSLNKCMEAASTDDASAQHGDSKAWLEGLLAAVNAAGRSNMPSITAQWHTLTLQPNSSSRTTLRLSCRAQLLVRCDQ